MYRDVYEVRIHLPLTAKATNLRALARELEEFEFFEHEVSGRSWITLPKEAMSALEEGKRPAEVPICMEVEQAGIEDIFHVVCDLRDRLARRSIAIDRVEREFKGRRDPISDSIEA
jgi:hypothetical protein